MTRGCFCRSICILRNSHTRYLALWAVLSQHIFHQPIWEKMRRRQRLVHNNHDGVLVNSKIKFWNHSDFVVGWSLWSSLSTFEHSFVRFPQAMYGVEEETIDFVWVASAVNVNDFCGCWFFSLSDTRNSKELSNLKSFFAFPNIRFLNIVAKSQNWGV